MAQRLVSIALLLFLIASAVYFDRRQQAVYMGDPEGYFIHLPSFLIHGDVGTYDRTLAAHKIYNPSVAHYTATEMGLPQSESGGRFTKYPVGVAILQSPFFGLAHLFCKITGRYPADGWSMPYVISGIAAGIFYGFLGLLVLFSALRGMFPSVSVRLFVVLGLALGTNLFYHITYNPGMAHTFEFFLGSVLVWLLGRAVLPAGDWKSFAAVGFMCGFIALVRNSDALYLLVPIFFFTSHFKIRELPRAFWEKRKEWAAAALAFALPLCFQVAYWLKTTGHFWYDGYVGEAFDFRHPKILKGLFGFTNGWLVYSPLMFLSVFGIIFGLRRFSKNWFLPIILLLPAHIYVIYSWWCWMYINGFGSRPMIDIYPVLAVSMAAFVQNIWGNKIARAMAATFLAFCIGLNLFQTWQMSEGIYWSEEGSKGYYLAMFGRTTPSQKALISFDNGLVQPDVTGLEKIETVFVDSMENAAANPNISAKNHFSGNHSLHCLSEYNAGFDLKLDTFPIGFDEKTWFRASVMGFIDPEDPFCWSRYGMASLWVTFTGGDGTYLYGKGVRIATKLGNPSGSIWSAGQLNLWGEAHFFYKMPENVNKSAKMNVTVWNPGKQHIFVDDLRVEIWREKN